MKGLIIKDFLCLRKQLTNYAFILAGVVVISILYVLSYRFGNIHAGILEMTETGQISTTETVQIFGLGILIFMLVPIACTGDITNLFMDDANASFYKVASSLPVSIDQRIICRFFSGWLFIAIGVIVDLIMAGILSSLTDLISFGDFCGVVISFASLMLMYVSMLILFMYLLGKEKATYANVIPLIIGVLIYILANWETVKAFLIGGEDDALFDSYNHTVEFIEHRFYLLFIAAVVVSAGSYFASVSIAHRKRGVA